MHVLPTLQRCNERALSQLRWGACAAATPARPQLTDWMNYRHAFHAGNFADVVKHVALTAILERLKKKDTPFVVIDTHAGRGIYDLNADEAARTREWESGIARLRDVTEGPAALITY